jgi:hypothetical protein
LAFCWAHFFRGRWYRPDKSSWPPYNSCRQTGTRQNTIGSEVEIYYPFHPLFGKKLKVIRRAIVKDGTILVNAPKGFCKEIPSWMTQAECLEYHISNFPHISLKAILRSIELLEGSIDCLLF